MRDDYIFHMGLDINDDPRDQFDIIQQGLFNAHKRVQIKKQAELEQEDQPLRKDENDE